MLNLVIRNGCGQPEVWPDAAYPGHRVALQYDGAHHGDPRQHRFDIRRQAVTELPGWTEVRVSRDDLDGDRPFLVEKVRAVFGRPVPAERTLRAPDRLDPGP